MQIKFVLASGDLEVLTFSNIEFIIPVIIFPITFWIDYFQIRSKSFVENLFSGLFPYFTIQSCLDMFNRFLAINGLLKMEFSISMLFDTRLFYDQNDNTKFNTLISDKSHVPEVRGIVKRFVVIYLKFHSKWSVNLSSLNAKYEQKIVYIYLVSNTEAKRISRLN